MHAHIVNSRNVVINYVGLAQAFPNYDYVQHVQYNSSNMSCLVILILNKCVVICERAGREVVVVVGGRSDRARAMADCFTLDTRTWRFFKVHL